MTAKRSLLSLLLLALPAGLVGLFLWSDPGSRGGEHRLPPLPEAPAIEPSLPVMELAPAPVVRTGTIPTVSTVLWPVKLELELAEARFLPTEAGVSVIGSGATARLQGQIAAGDDQGAQAEVTFVAGPNTGRVLRTGPDGRFGASDLYPGLSIVEVRGPGLPGSRRLVRLRREKETLFNLGYGRPGQVFGRVQDSSGEGIEGAEVVVDGTRVFSGPDGGFYLSSVAAGPVLCEVQRDGYALYEEQVWIAGGAVTPKERMTFTLRPEVSLTVALDGNAGGPGPAQLYLISDPRGGSSTAAIRSISYPWHRINPIEIWPGTPVTITGLPDEVVKLHVFRAGARATVRPVNLAGGLREVSLHLEPAPQISGRVTQDGEPVFGASVRLEAPDRVRATLDYFLESSYFLESTVLPDLPPGLQQVTTGKDGRFTLSAWEDNTPVRYLEARGPGGGGWAGRLVHPGEQEIELQLTDLDLGDSTLRLDFPGRFQGLPIEVWIGGSPRSSQILPADEELEISDLLAGRWRLALSWHAQPLPIENEIVIDGTERRTIALPPECIQGQDEEAWRRAGREFPR